MSKKRAEPQATSGQRASRGSNGFLVIAVAVVAVVGLGIWLSGRGPGEAGRHPEPRANAATLETESPSRYAGYPRIHRVYAMALQTKETLDGLYCYCRCREHSNHYSLLTCFQSDHGAGCDVCLDQAALAYQLARTGASLDQIRQETDRMFGSGRRGG